MNSVAHVVLILRRLVNVVSTFSISQQYFSESLNNLNGPWWTVRRKIDTRREIRTSECKSTQISKNNLTGLGHIFSPFSNYKLFIHRRTLIHHLRRLQNPQNPRKRRTMIKTAHQRIQFNPLLTILKSNRQTSFINSS